MTTSSAKIKHLFSHVFYKSEVGAVAASTDLEVGGNSVGLQEDIHHDVGCGADLGQLSMILGTQVQVMVEQLLAHDFLQGIVQDALAHV